jgi:hypothetical protein
MEEMVQALFEEGVLQRNGAVKLAQSMSAVKVPATRQRPRNCAEVEEFQGAPRLSARTVERSRQEYKGRAS